MSEDATPKKPTAATYAEIVSGCKGINPENAEDAQFICDQQKNAATVEDARGAWMDTLNARAENARKERDQAVTESKDAARGQKPVSDTPSKDGPSATGSDDAEQRWNEAIAAKVKAGKPKAEAVRELKNEQPDLYESYLEEYNATHETTDEAKRRHVGKK